MNARAARRTFKMERRIVCVLLATEYAPPYHANLPCLQAFEHIYFSFMHDKRVIRECRTLHCHSEGPSCFLAIITAGSRLARHTPNSFLLFSAKNYSRMKKAHARVLRTARSQFMCFAFPVCCCSMLPLFIPLQRSTHIRKCARANVFAMADTRMHGSRLVVLVFRYDVTATKPSGQRPSFVHCTRADMAK